MVMSGGDPGVGRCLTFISMSTPRYAVEQPPRGQRRMLLERIGRGAEVLDIGCWAGAAGRFLIERGAKVDGVEPDAEMAVLASEHYRSLVCERIEVALPALRDERPEAYDAILFLDVLEHLADPWSVLEGCHALLRADGRAYVSLPNVAHWTMRKHLLLGRWDYEAYGLLDRTHLRFFTLESARDLLEGSGWRILSEAADVDQPPVVHLPARWLPLLGRWPRLFAVQNLFELSSTRMDGRSLMRPPDTAPG